MLSVAVVVELGVCCCLAAVLLAEVATAAVLRLVRRFTPATDPGVTGTPTTSMNIVVAPPVFGSLPSSTSTGYSILLFPYDKNICVYLVIVNFHVLVTVSEVIGCL
jgi:hypothetical protein